MTINANTAVIRRPYGGKLLAALAGINLLVIGLLTFWEMILDYGVWGNLFPLLIVASGAVLLWPSERAVRIAGALIFAAGVLAQYTHLAVGMAAQFQVILAVLLILLGAVMVAGAALLARRGRGDPLESSAVVLGERIDTIGGQFKGRAATTLFGTTAIDLTGAAPAGAQVVEINAATLFGKTGIKLGREWRVELRATALMGDQRVAARPPGAEPAHTLVVTGFTICGGLSIGYEA